MIRENLRITDRPWQGRCATTGLTMDEFEGLLARIDAPDWVTRAAISITRAYATVLTGGAYENFPVARLVELIEAFRSGTQRTTPEVMAAYEAAEKLDSEPQYPGEDPWLREVGVTICEEFTVIGLCDPLYIANTIRGEEIDVDDPGRRYREAARLNKEAWRAASVD